MLHAAYANGMAWSMAYCNSKKNQVQSVDLEPWSVCCHGLAFKDRVPCTHFDIFLTFFDNLIDLLLSDTRSQRVRITRNRDH